MNREPARSPRTAHVLRRAAGIAAAPILAFLVAGRASAQSLDDSIRQIPVVAVDAVGIWPEEQELAEEIQAFGPAAIPRLLPLLESPSEPVREFAGYVLRDLRGLTEEHLDALIRARREGNGWIPFAIARVGNPRAIAFLVEDLRAAPESNDQVREALRWSGAKAARAIAGTLREDSPIGEEFVREAGRALSEMGSPAAVVIDSLAEIALGRRFDLVRRRAAVEWLGDVGLTARRVIPALRQLADSEPEEFAKSVDDAVVEIGGPEAARILARRLREKRDRLLLRDIAILGENGFEAGEAVSELLSSKDRELRACAARTLGFIGDSRSHRELARTASDADDWILAIGAVESLGRLCAESERSALEQAAQSYWYPPVRDAAQRALRAIEGSEEYEWPADWRETIRLWFACEHAWRNLELSGDLPGFVPDGFALTREELDASFYESEIVGWGTEGRSVHRVKQTPDCGLHVDGGVLLGASRGEWGGELVLRRAGAPDVVLIDDNMHGVYRTPSGIVAITGLGHMSFDRGALHRIDPLPDGSYSATWWKRLPGEPQNHGLLEDGSLFIRCHGGDVVLTPDGRLAMYEPP